MKNKSADYFTRLAEHLETLRAEVEAWTRDTSVTGIIVYILIFLLFCSPFNGSIKHF